MKRYLICVNDHLGHKKDILYSNIRYNKYEGLEEIQHLAESFIKKICGDIEITYYNEGQKGRKYGYFIMKPLCNNNCLSIYRKYIDRGYVYNSVVVQKIMSFYLLECLFPKMNIEENYYIELPDKQKFNKVIKQLKIKFGIFDNEEESTIDTELSYEDLTDFNFSE